MKNAAILIYNASGDMFIIGKATKVLSHTSVYEVLVFGDKLVKNNTFYSSIELPCKEDVSGFRTTAEAKAFFMRSEALHKLLTEGFYFDFCEYDGKDTFTINCTNISVLLTDALAALSQLNTVLTNND